MRKFIITTSLMVIASGITFIAVSLHESPANQQPVGATQIRVGNQVLWTTDLKPYVNNSVDLGASDKKVKKIYGVDGDFSGDLTVGGSIIGGGISSEWTDDGSYLYPNETDGIIVSSSSTIHSLIISDGGLIVNENATTTGNLDVAGHIAVGGTGVTDTDAIKITETYTSTADYNGIYSNPLVAPSSATANSFAGIRSEPDIGGTENWTTGSEIVAFESKPYHSQAGEYTGNTNLTVKGVVATGYYNSVWWTGHVFGEAYGLEATAFTIGGAESSPSSISATTSYGVMIRNPETGGSIFGSSDKLDTNYGLYVENQKEANFDYGDDQPGEYVGLDYGIYLAGADTAALVALDSDAASETKIGFGTSTPDHLLTLANGGLCIDDGTGVCGTQATSSSGYLYLAGSATTSGSLYISDDLFVNSEFDIPADTLAEGDINFSTSCGSGNHLYINGNDLACETDDDVPEAGDFGAATDLDTNGAIICTDCLNATEIEDIYLLNTTDVATGLTVTYSTSTDSLVIPQGTGPDVDIAGELAIDTTSGQLVYHDGSAKRVLTYKKEKCFTTASTTFNGFDNIPLWSPHQAITVTDIYCRVDGGTSVQVTAGDGTNNMDTITCDTDGQDDDGSISNSTFTANERFEVDFGTVSGSVNWVNYCITYTIDAD